LGQVCPISPRRCAHDHAPLGHTKLESTVCYLGIEIDDALAIAEQIDL
jgi:hypothetical protein